MYASPERRFERRLEDNGRARLVT